MMHRRGMLKLVGQIALGSGVWSTVIKPAVAAEGVCADPKQMDSGQSSIRESLKYTEHSADAKSTCSNCQFFEAKGAGCGHCMIFMGPANPKGHCDSWSLKS